MNPVFNSLDIVVSDLDASIAFYRRPGLDFQPDASMPEHAGCDLPGGLHLMLDAEKLTAAAPAGLDPRRRQPAGLPVLPAPVTRRRRRRIR